VGYSSPDDLYEAIGAGDLDVLGVIEKAAEMVHLDLYDQQLSLVLNGDDGDDESPFTGVGDLSYRIAECCMPVPGDLIVGVVDETGTVLVHQQECLQALRVDLYGSLMRLDWKVDAIKTFPVAIEIVAYDRPGLLYDITGIFMHENTNVITLNTEIDKHNSHVSLKMVIEVGSLNGLLRTLEKIEQLSNVITARRTIAA
jgi:GTP pyrophosphokinase